MTWQGGPGPDCLDRATLQGLTRQALDPAEDARAREHVASCSTCSRDLFAMVLLSREEQATQEVGPPRPLPPPAPPPSHLPRGSLIGRYVVTDPIGSGGMGVVYAAFDPELDRKVAIKLLQSVATSRTPSTTASAGQALLLREAQAMARLSHPNVIAVHDVGVWGDRVFVAMELVQGVTLRAYLEEKPRPARDVLRVMVEAGRGLAAAHAAGLIHRDFKPDNILVAADGRVRVMDFGLARAAASSGPDLPVGPGAGAPAAPAAPATGSSSGLVSAQLTQAGVLLGTPAYMAPELLRGGAADPRTDQFAFGVTLHEALHGERPFPPGDDPNDPKRWTLAPPSRGRAVPAWLRRVALRALEVDPAARFPSMDAALEALGKDPASARRRAAWAAGLALVVLGSAAGTYAVATRASRLCSGAEAQLKAVWDEQARGEVEAAFLRTGQPFAADALASSTRQLDAYAGAWVAMRTDACQATRVRREQPESVLSLRMACLDRRLSDLAALVAVFRSADAMEVQHAAEAAGRLPGLKGCDDVSALTALVPAPDDPAARAQVESLRGRLSQPKAALLAGRFQEGLEQARALADEARRLGYAPALAESLDVLSRLLDASGDYKAAERAALEAARAAQAGRDDEAGARAWALLAQVVGFRQTRFEAGHEHAAMARATASRLGRRPALEGAIQAVEGSIFVAEGRYQEALAESTAAVHSLKATLGEDHPDTIAALFSLANVQFRRAELDLSAETYRRVLALREQVLGREHPGTAAGLHGLASVLTSAGKLEEAYPLYLRSLAIRERTLGKDHPDLASTHLNLTALFAMQERFGEALPHGLRTLEILEKAHGGDHANVAYALNNIGNLYFDTRQLEQALEFHRRALAMRERVFGAESTDVAQSLKNLADVYLRKGEPAQALEYARKAVAMREKVLPPLHKDLATALFTLCEAQLRLGRFQEALASAERGMEIREKARLGPADMGEAKVKLGKALWETGKDRRRALELAEEGEKLLAQAKRAQAAEEVRAWLKTHQAGTAAR